MSQLERLNDLVKQSRQDDMVEIEIWQKDGKRAVGWFRKDECIMVNTKWGLKVDVILDVFSENEWVEEVMRVIGEGKPDAKKVSELMEDPKWVTAYKDLRDRYAQMAKESIERTGARGVSRVDWGV